MCPGGPLSVWAALAPSPRPSHHPSVKRPHSRIRARLLQLRQTPPRADPGPGLPAAPGTTVRGTRRAGTAPAQPEPPGLTNPQGSRTPDVQTGTPRPAERSAASEPTGQTGPRHGTGGDPGWEGQRQAETRSEKVNDQLRQNRTLQTGNPGEVQAGCLEPHLAGTPEAPPPRHLAPAFPCVSVTERREGGT